MKSGGAVPKAAIAGLMFAVAGCGSQNPPAKVSPLPSASPNVNTAGAAGAPISPPTEPLAEDFPDPSKLLATYNESDGSDKHPAVPSKSGLNLEVRERGPGEPWLLHIVNRGDQPAELVADTRLLWFEVKLPGKKKQSVCRLPEPLSPTSQPEPRLIVHLKPGEGVVDQFDPRLYCFAEGDQKLLVPDAEVTPHFGWTEAPPKKRWRKGKLVEEPALQKPPFVARQSLEDAPAGPAPSGVAPKAAARLSSAGISGADKQLEGATLTLRTEYAEWTKQKPPVESEEPSLTLRLVQGSDARAEHDATVQLTLSNQSPLASHVYFRREMVSFEVAGPSGISQCPGRLDDRTPERSAFMRLAPEAQRSYTSRLAELCPRGTFAIPGLYLVYARFDATLTGQEQGLQAFVGPVYAKKAATVRIRTGEQAIFQKRPMMRTDEKSSTNATGAQ